MHELIDPPADTFVDIKRRIELSDAAVLADAVNVTGAGTETTGATKERALYEVISNPVIYETITRELRNRFPDPAGMRVASLEKMPYLAGIIKEALR